MAIMLGESLPATVTIEGLEYAINSDYRVGIEFETMLRGHSSSEHKLQRLLSLYYPVIPANIPEAIDKAMWFYRCGREAEEKKEESKAKQRYKRRESESPAYAFDQDGAYIYASFKEQYDIDLSSDDYMHWWKFVALFESLGENTKMAQIMFYRKVSVSGLPKEKRAFYNEMKRLYKLHDGEKEKLTIEERNHQWRDYVEQRRKEIENNQG